MMKVPEKDVQMLSDYLDGQLTPADRQKLETRMHSSPDLRETYDDLRRLRGMLRSLPKRKVPHNFTLTRAMAAEARRVSRWFPLLRFSSALAALAAVILMVIQLLPAAGAGVLSAPASVAAPAAQPRAALPNAAQENSASAASGQATPTLLIFQWGAGATGMGGGGGGAEGSGLPNAPAAKAIPPGYGVGGGPDSQAATESAPEMLAQPLAPPLEATPAPTTESAPSASTDQANPPAAPAQAEPTTAAAQPTVAAAQATAVPAPEGTAPPSGAPATAAQDQSGQFILGLPSQQDQGKITLPEAPASPPAESASPQADAYSAAAESAGKTGQAAIPLEGILAGILALVALGAGLAAYFLRSGGTFGRRR